MNNIIYECVVGSHAYGTNIETSDIDIKGVYAQSIDDLIGTKYVPQHEPNADTTYYELRRFVELAATANPTILEMMFVDNKFINVCIPGFEILMNNRKMFLTKKCYNSFAGYAFQQIQKAKGLDKKMNWERERIVRKNPIDFCYVQVENGSKPLKNWLETFVATPMVQQFCGLQAITHMPNCYLIYYDWNAHFGMSTGTPNAYPPIGYKGIAFEDSNDIRLSSIPKYAEHTGIMYYNKDAYSLHCKEYREYEEWLQKRNTTRYVDSKNHGQQIDGKNLMHCVRLIDTAIDIVKHGDLIVFRPNAKELIDIRKGNVDLNDIIAESEEKLKRLKNLFESSNLPDTVDPEQIHELILEIRHEIDYENNQK